MFCINNSGPDKAMPSWYYVMNEREYFGKISVITGPAYLGVPAEFGPQILSQYHTISQSILTGPFSLLRGHSAFSPRERGLAVQCSVAGSDWYLICVGNIEENKTTHNNGSKLEE